MPIRPLSVILSLFLLIAFSSLTGCQEEVSGPTIIDGVQILPGNLQLRSQTEVNQMHGLREVGGYLNIQCAGSDSDPIVDLRPLASLETVRGDFSMSGNSHIQTLAGLENLIFVGGDFYLFDFPELTSFSGLGSIEGFNLIRLQDVAKVKNFGTWCQPESLFSLHVSGCDSLGSLSGLEHLRSLGLLEISNCDNMQNLDALSGLTYISRCTLAGNAALKRLPALLATDYPLSLSLNWVSADFEWASLANWPSVDTLWLSACPSLDGLSPLGDMPFVRSVSIVNSNFFTSFQEHGSFPSLTYLNVTSCPNIVTFEGLADFPALQGLSIGAGDNQVNLTGLGDFPQLERLTINGGHGLESLSGLPAYPTVEELRLEYSFALNDLAAISTLENLTQLTMQNCPLYEGLSTVGFLPSLESLKFARCFGLTDLSGLSAPDSLISFSLDSCDLLEDFSGLQWLVHADHLSIHSNAGLTSLAGLDNLGSAGSFVFTNNRYLSTCLIEEFIVDIEIEGATIISGNLFCP